MAYIVYCDESSDKGSKYTDFFGGCIIRSADQFEIIQALESKKKELNLFQEVKWTKVTENYLGKYMELIDLFFDYVRSGKIKVRVMFRSVVDGQSYQQNRTVDDKYFKLYYQFLKHSFGLMTIPENETPTNIIVYLDVLPDKHGLREQFKRYVHEMPRSNDFSGVRITIRERDIIEVDSKDHVLMQCVDVVLGAMFFKLNGLNKAIPEGQKRRGKRTIAKEKLYKHIYTRICDMHPNFNAGISTGSRGSSNQHWESPYEHWLFVSSKN